MKLNQLLHKITCGTVVTASWLASHGVTSDQARKLVGGGWLQRAGAPSWFWLATPDMPGTFVWSQIDWTLAKASGSSAKAARLLMEPDRS